jgi:uncharacterized C2H2 Zn-finger protein
MIKKKTYREQVVTKPNKDKIRTKCPYCDKVYEWKRGLRRHLSKYHIEERKQS